MTEAVRVLCDRLIDYAGLFPPSQLSMSDAVQQYACYRKGAHEWMLGRFVVHCARLTEFTSVFEAEAPPASKPWRISAILSENAETDIAALAALNSAHRGVLCDAVETKAASVEDVARIARAVRGASLETYVEIPVRDDPAPLIEAIAANGLRAKLRTGGTVPQAFPSAEDVARFVGVCVRAKVPFKATAGLHHPLRGEYRLTYEQNAPQGTMFGFLNVFLAAALLRDGEPDAKAAELLAERDVNAFTFANEGIRWRNHLMLNARLAQLRDRAAVSFGSCSFAEPVDELSALELI